MTCPYICDIVQTNQNKYEFDEDGRNTFHEHVLTEKKRPIECAGENCGAWRDGGCHYGGEEC